MYNKIREKVIKHKLLFQIIHFFFTPIRIVKEFFIRRKMATQLIAQYSGLQKRDKKIFYFGVPEHNNLGDLAQTYCTREWISANYPNYKVIEIKTRISFDKKFVDYIKQILNINDIFIFQSGYCTRDTNPDHLMHKHIMNNFPNQKAVILPQTVKLKSLKEIEKTKNIFSKCDHLLFLARDTVSYEQAKCFMNLSQLELFPDIVTSMIGKEHKRIDKAGILLCVRNDDEKFYSDIEIENIIQKLYALTNIVDITDTNSHLCIEETYNNLENIILNKIKTFKKYKVIITDRYHGTIFSLIANTSVIVIKTTDHKVTSGLNWFNGIYDKSSVCFADNLDMAVSLAKDILTNEQIIINNDYFYKTYYEHKLKEKIHKL